MSRRRQNGMGVNPLSNLEVNAWLDRRYPNASITEIDALFRIDDAYVEHANSKLKKKEAPKDG